MSVYTRRRIVVGLAALVVVLGVVVGLASLFGDDDEPGRVTSGSSTSTSTSSSTSTSTSTSSLDGVGVDGSTTLAGTGRTTTTRKATTTQPPAETSTSVTSPSTTATTAPTTSSTDDPMAAYEDCLADLNTDSGTADPSTCDYLKPS